MTRLSQNEASSVPDVGNSGIESLMKNMMRESNRTRLHAYHKIGGSPIEQFIKVLAQRRKDYNEIPELRESLARTFELKISLLSNETDVWRKIKVPAAIDLAKFHDQVLVPVIGWCRGYHAYVFRDPKDGAILGPKKYAGHIDMMHAPMKYYYVMDDRDTPLGALLSKIGDFIFYTYDIGDNWELRIELVGVVVDDPMVHPASYDIALLGGAGACPPEDSIGLDGKGQSLCAIPRTIQKE